MAKLRRTVGDFIFHKHPAVAALVAGMFGYLKAPRKSFSLYGEDLLVLEIFGHSSDGLYVDIGAFHERWISNTHALSKLGWSGVAVDVEKGKLISFKMRKNCLPIVGAVVPKDFPEDEVTLYKFRRISSEYDTIDKNTADQYAIRYGMNYDSIKVRAIPIDTLLEITAKRFKGRIRYLNIDVEGADEAILTSIEPEVFGVEVVQFEDNRNLGGSPRLRAHLTGCGYTFLASQGGTHTYVTNQLITDRFPGAGDDA